MNLPNFRSNRGTKNRTMFNPTANVRQNSECTTFCVQRSTVANDPTKQSSFELVPAFKCFTEHWEREVADFVGQPVLAPIRCIWRLLAG
ncbi:hypothetical protein NPIL_633061 [Nephila pilipes]|uniref:Uncharacterized protein n=1 Tax=Nephila pilipes TaxID=299642 RepID=A0A8X6Q6P9_NEPPI|nr:hypothetical protein NPIL_633061 [Nephila pilipes]